MFPLFRGREEGAPDCSDDAERLFRKVAEELNLHIDKRENDPVELSMDIPQQEGLKYGVWLCLQNRDELWFCVEDFFTCSMFPYLEVKDTFELLLKNTLSGEYRIAAYCMGRKSRPLGSELQRPSGAGWETVRWYSRSLGIDRIIKPMLKTDILILRDR